jgi:hypothetical protein
MDTPKATTQKTNREIAAAVFGEERAAYTNPIFLPFYQPMCRIFFKSRPCRGSRPLLFPRFLGRSFFCVMLEKAAHTERIKKNKNKIKRKKKIKK